MNCGFDKGLVRTSAIISCVGVYSRLMTWLSIASRTKFKSTMGLNGSIFYQSDTTTNNICRPTDLSHAA